MRLRIGSYQFDPNAVAIATRKETIFDDRGLPAAEKHFFDMQGQIFGTSQVDITNKCALLERAMRRQFQDVILYRDDGGIAMALRGATALGGVRITGGPDYPNSDGFEYSQGRTFVLRAEAEYALAVRPGNLGSVLISFTEALAFRGGGAVSAFMPVVNQAPVRSRLFAATPYQANQSGSALALGTWPSPPNPLWPAAMGQAPEVVYQSPQLGPRGLGYGISWNYQFESVTPLRGRPNQFVGTG